MAKVKIFYWKLFFSAYWISYNLGEKDDPQINASYFMVLVSGFNFTGIVFLINFLNKGLSPNPQIYFIFAYLIPIVFHVNVLFFVDGGYKKKN